MNHTRGEILLNFNPQKEVESEKSLNQIYADPVHQEVLQTVVPKAKGSGNCERYKRRCAWRTLAPTKHKDGQSNTTTDRQNSPNRTKINGFTDYLPFFLNTSLQLRFPSLHGKELSDYTSQLQLSSAWSQEQAPPSIQRWVTCGLR